MTVSLLINIAELHIREESDECRDNGRKELKKEMGYRGRTVNGEEKKNKKKELSGQVS